MRCFGSAPFLLAAVAVMGIGVAETRAEMLANVAAGKPVTAVSEFGYYGDARLSPPMAVDEQKVSATGYVSQKYLDNVWWQVDLGAEFDFDTIDVYCRHLNNAHLHLNGAYLCAYDDTHAEIATQVLGSYYYYTGGANTTFQTWNNAGSGWIGARYLAVEDRDGVLNVYNDALNLNEVRAKAVIPTYPTYIANVTASGNMLYSSGGHYDVQYELMVNGEGMTDQTGLSGEMLLGDPDALAREINGGQWTSGIVDETKPYLIYDLQQAYDDARMLVWNRNAPTFQTYGVKDVTISVSLDGENYTDLADTNGATQGTHTIAQSPGGNAAYQADINMGGATARYVKLSALSSWGGNDWGIAEVRFYVPEPSTLMLVAIGALVLVCRRRS